MSNDCYTCGEKFEEKCPESKSKCGHHSNYSWTHDECPWCGRKFGLEGETVRFEIAILDSKDQYNSDGIIKMYDSWEDAKKDIKNQRESFPGEIKEIFIERWIKDTDGIPIPSGDEWHKF